MLSPETLAECRRMTPGQRLALALRMTDENLPSLLERHSIDIDVFLAESDYQRAIMDRRQSHEVAGRGACSSAPRTSCCSS
jgi:hypothetical protein